MEPQESHTSRHIGEVSQQEKKKNLPYTESQTHVCFGL